jgi:small conductance mechanosensitive channel
MTWDTIMRQETTLPVADLLKNFSWLPAVGVRIVLIALTWLAVSLIARRGGGWIRRTYTRVRVQEMDPLAFRALELAIQSIAVMIGALITLAILGLTSLLVSVLTAAGVTGIIVGFAVKDAAANVISGVLLLLERPFSLGDAVTVGTTTGTVEQISLRSTRVRTLEGPLVTVPNSIIAAGAITNYSVNPLRRVELVLTLSRGVDPNRATRLLLDLAAREPRLAPESVPQVLIGDIRDFSFDLKLVFQVPNTVWSQVQSDMKRALLALIQEEQLSAGLPAQMVYTAPIAQPLPQTAQNSANLPERR